MVGVAASPPPPTERKDRRAIVVASAILFGVLAVMLAIALITAPWVEGSSADRRAARNDAIARDQSVARPDYGHKPHHPGDPGGWEQLALGGLLAVALVGGTWRVVHVSRKAKATRRSTAAASQP